MADCARQRVQYSYDGEGPTSYGRLTSVRWNWTLNGSSQVIPCATGGGFDERYSCNSAGRITQKQLYVRRIVSGSLKTLSMKGNWTYNSYGQTT